MPGTAIQVGYATNRFAGDGSETVWEFDFEGGYIAPEFVKARIETPEGVQTPITFEWVGQYQIRVTPAVPAGQFLVVFRDTQKDELLVDFQLGALRTPENLNKDLRQALHVATEAMDTAEVVRDYAIDAAADAASAAANASTALAQAQAAAAAAALAQSQVGSAESAAAAAQIAAAIAQADAAEAVSIAGGVGSKADQALANSSQALATANGVDSKATQALSTAAQAEANVNGALVAANNATAAADAAVAEAQDAIDAANAVSSVAAQANANASAAVSAAAAADAKAVAAQGAAAAADSKAVAAQNAAGDKVSKAGDSMTGSLAMVGDWKNIAFSNTAGRILGELYTHASAGGWTLLSRSATVGETGTAELAALRTAANTFSLTWNNKNLGVWADYNPAAFSGGLARAESTIAAGSAWTFADVGISGDSVRLMYTNNWAVGSTNGVFNFLGYSWYLGARQLRIGGTNASVAFNNSGALTFLSDSHTNGGHTFSIAADGNLVLNTNGKSFYVGSGRIYAGSFQTVSDARKKTEIRQITGAWARVSQISGYTYKLTLPGYENRRMAGVLAQELRGVLPEAVEEDSDGMLTVDPMAVIGLLLQAVKELGRRVRVLEGGA